MQDVNNRGNCVWGEGGGQMEFFVTFAQFFYKSKLF